MEPTLSDGDILIASIDVVPEKIDEIVNKYKSIEKQGLPLYNLGFNTKLEKWNADLNACKEKLSNLDSRGVMASLNKIQDDIVAMDALLDSEVENKNYFTTNSEKMDLKVMEIQKSYLKLCAVLPEVRQIYMIDESQEVELENLKVIMNNLDTSKRTLDGFIHSSTKQPYSTLKMKLDDLSSNYDMAYSGILNFKTYLDSLKKKSEEAYDLVFVYYYRAKNIEMILREMNVPEFANHYVEKINSCYNLLNDIDILIKIKPIDVNGVSEKVEELKNLANNMFDEIENKAREMQLAESAIVYANRDRNHQADVHRRLNGLEKTFFEGDFETAYHDANGLYRTTHVD